MKAQVIFAHGTREQIQYESNWQTPSPADGEVLIKVHACALNYHDVFTMRGMPGIRIPFPVIMGIDAAGEIVEVGANAGQWKVGQRVVIDPIDRVKGTLFGETKNGGLAEYAVIGADQLLEIPENVTYEQAAALPCAYGTAYRMMVTRGQIAAGEKVLILGASGGVGTCCVQLAKMAGAHVIAAASTEEKMEKLRAIGAAETVNYKERSFMEQVHELHGKPKVWGEGGVDVIVNFTGGDTWVPGLRCLKKHGRVLTCGATAGYDPKTDLRFVWTFEHQILGSNGWLKEDVATLLTLVSERKLDPIVEQRYPLANARAAFADLEERRAFGKIIVTPW